MDVQVKPMVKAPISKAKFYGYVTKPTLENEAPKLLRTLCITPEVHNSELDLLAKFFMEMGEEEIITHVLVVKNVVEHIRN